MAEKFNSEKMDASPPVDPSATVFVTVDDSSIESANAELLAPTYPPSTELLSDTKVESVQFIGPASPELAQEACSAKRSKLGMSLEILKLFLIPLLIFAAFAVGIALLGIAQRFEWIKSASPSPDSSAVGMTSEESDVSWICPMMCVPPTNKPGRCPVCAMELVPASKGSSSGPSSTIEIDPRSRRVAGIKTTVAKLKTLSREVSSVGEIKYDETQQKTLSAYIDGRIEELKADYTGVEVKKGESLGLLYSPDLYSAQVEYVKTLEFNERSNSSNARVRSSNQRLLKSSRQRLIELGMTEPQIKKLESDRVAQPSLGFIRADQRNRHRENGNGWAVHQGWLHRSTDWQISAKSGWSWNCFLKTPKPFVWVKQSPQRLSLWVVRSFAGTVEFIEPTVDPKMRTVGVRVAINNETGLPEAGRVCPSLIDDSIARNRRRGPGNGRHSSQQPAVDWQDFLGLRGNETRRVSASQNKNRPDGRRHGRGL